MILVVVIIGILSVLLFRTLADMTLISGRIQFEKILSRDLMNIHMSTSYLSEQYPYIDIAKYQGKYISNWYVDRLYLKKDETNTAELFLSGQALWLQESNWDNSQTTALTDETNNILTGVVFRLLPTVYYTGTQRENVELPLMSSEWFWIFGTMHPNTNNTKAIKITSNIQHFVHLKP